MTSNGRMWAGLGCGVAAGALWGLVFLAPQLVREFTPLQLAAARYLAYGLFAAALIAPRWRRLVRVLGPREWGALVWLSLLGNIVYYVLLASAVQLGGIAMTSLIIGFLPVAVTLIGSRDHGATPLARLAPSLLLGTAGILCIGWQSLGSIGSGLQPDALLGLACAIAALASWSTYAVQNARWLVRVRHLSSQDWNLLTGIVTGALSLLLLPPALLIGARPRHQRMAALRRGCGRRGAVRLDRRQFLLELDEPADATDPGRPDDPVRDPVRPALRLPVGAPTADDAGKRRHRSGGGERARLRHRAPGAERRDRARQPARGRLMT